MISARNAAIVVLPSSSLMVALISQMPSTASRHGPAATTEACAKDAMRSAMELLRYNRSSAKPIPAIIGQPSQIQSSRHRLRRRRHVAPIDRRIGLVHDVEIVGALHPLLHRGAEPLPAVFI